MDWDSLVEDFFYRGAKPDLDSSQRASISRLFTAASLVSLKSYQGSVIAFTGVIGKLGELLYTTVVNTPYALYRAARYYPLDISYKFGIDLWHLWPDEPTESAIEVWLGRWPFSQDFTVVVEAFDLVEDGEIEVAEQLVEDWLPMALEDAISQLESVINALSDSVQEEVTEIIEKLDRVIQAVDPMQSQFVDATDPSNPVIPIKRPPGSGLTVFPDPSQADTAVNLEELTIYPNLFDLVAIGIHLISAYLGADRLPRPYYPALADSSAQPDWQINNLADLIGQLHSELREIALVDTEVRKEAEDNSQPVQIQTNLGTAIGLLLSAISEIGLDSERILALSAQAAQAALTANAQIGSKTEPSSVDLGFRGKVPVPVNTGASLAQQLNAIETLLGAIAVQLGVSLKPSGG
jgi:hypothetical protein